jgi:hypothetical protein
MAEKDIGGKSVKRENMYTSESIYRMAMILIGWLIYAIPKLLALSIVVIGFPLILDLVIGSILVSLFSPRKQPDIPDETFLNNLMKELQEIERTENFHEQMDQAQYVDEQWLEIDVTTENQHGEVIVSRMPKIQFGFDDMNNIYIQEDEYTWSIVGRDY